jgi:hypothetical protein
VLMIAAGVALRQAEQRALSGQARHSRTVSA